MKTILILLLALSMTGCAAVDIMEMERKAPKGTHYDYETGTYQKDEK